MTKQLIQLSNITDSDSDSGVAIKDETRLPPMFTVILLNDDFTPMDFVITILKRIGWISGKWLTEAIIGKPSIASNGAILKIFFILVTPWLWVNFNCIAGSDNFSEYGRQLPLQYWCSWMPFATDRRAGLRPDTITAFAPAKNPPVTEARLRLASQRRVSSASITPAACASMAI